jgi:hypothetical protein
MKEILENCKRIEGVTKNSVNIKLMEELGVNPLLIKQEKLKENNLIVITPEIIAKFLTKKCTEKIPLPDKFKNPYVYHDYWRDSSDEDDIYIIRELSFTEQTNWEGWGKGIHHKAVWYWVETLVSRITDCIPTNCLQILKSWKEKNIFDYFTVATVKENHRPLNDPFLIGRIKEDSNRYFLCQWGDDINIDNII